MKMPPNLPVISGGFKDRYTLIEQSSTVNANIIIFKTKTSSVAALPDPMHLGSIVPVETSSQIPTVDPPLAIR